MRDERADPALVKRVEKRGEVGVVKLSRVAAARVAREERERGGTDGDGVGRHGRIAVRG